MLSSRKSLAPTSRPKERQSPCSEPCPQQITPSTALPRAKSQYLSKALLASFVANQEAGCSFVPAWLVNFFGAFRWCACWAHHPELERIWTLATKLASFLSGS